VVQPPTQVVVEPTPVPPPTPVEVEPPPPQTVEEKPSKTKESNNDEYRQTKITKLDQIKQMLDKIQETVEAKKTTAERIALGLAVRPVGRPKAKPAPKGESQVIAKLKKQAEPTVEAPDISGTPALGEEPAQEPVQTSKLPVSEVRRSNVLNFS
jgi:hypothetical protein